MTIPPQWVGAAVMWLATVAVVVVPAGYSIHTSPISSSTIVSVIQFQKMCMIFGKLRKIPFKWCISTQLFVGPHDFSFFALALIIHGGQIDKLTTVTHVAIHGYFILLFTGDEQRWILHTHWVTRPSHWPTPHVLRQWEWSTHQPVQSEQQLRHYRGWAYARGCRLCQ